MGDMRIPYGLALGRMNNWTATYQGKTSHLIAQANTAPDVTNGVIFFTTNSAATTIEDFKLTTPHGSAYNVAGLFEGKVIKIFFKDANTTISGTQIFLASSSNTAFSTNSWLGLIYHNSGWYETERSIQNNAAVSRSIAVGATNEAITVTAADRLILLAGTSPTPTITGISGGYIGQQIILIAGSGGCSPILANTLGNIYMSGTASFRMAGISSAANISSVIATKISASYWTVSIPAYALV